MAHEIDYTTITDEFERREIALKDLKRWLGQARYKKISKIALEEKAKGYSRESMVASMDLFAGVSGFPVQVWLDYLGFPQQTPNTSVTSGPTPK